MKIIHINSSDLGGGAAIAAGRHCEAMIRNGIDSEMLTISKGTHKPYVRKFHQGIRFVLPLLYGILHNRLLTKLKPVANFSVMEYGAPLYQDMGVKNADVIFLHWINNNTLSLQGIEKILQLGKPTFWYMHDMLPITGGCHYSLTCDSYSKECKDCPQICKKSEANKEWNRKIKSFKKYDNLAFVTPSKWLYGCVESSTIANGHKVHLFPNLIDTDLFKPLPFDTKVMFGLDSNKKTILFSADLSGSLYKGSQYTIDCLKQLDPEKFEGLIIGNMPKGIQDVLPIRIIATGYLMDSLSLVVAYNACDTFIISSIAENYPNVVLEAMACGKPCVGFKTGGIPDFIHHGKTGYLTSENNSDDLLKGIGYLFSDEERYKNMSQCARKQIVETNDYKHCLAYLNSVGVKVE